MTRTKASVAAIGGRRLASVLGGLALSCHPLPTIAVSAIAAGLAALAGLGLSEGLLLVAAVLAGQLSIGWSNDRIDVARDRAVGRRDKPVASGAIRPGVVASAAGLALIATVALSAFLGVWAGSAALATVACGWIYNLGVKGTVFSWLPYAVAFGLLPAATTLGLPGHPWPAPWVIATGALLGVAAHFANVLPDLQSDRATGVRGLPHRLGESITVVSVPILLLIASAVILLRPGASWAGRWVILGFFAAVAALGAVLGLRRPGTKVLFLATIVVAIGDIALVALSGAALT